MLTILAGFAFGGLLPTYVLHRFIARQRAVIKG